MQVLPEGWERAGPAWKLLAALLVGAASVATGDVARQYSAGTLTRYGAGLLEAACFAAAILLFLSWLQPALDELQERIRLKAYRFAFLACALGLYGYGILVEAGVPATRFETIAILMFFVFGMAMGVASRRYS